MPVGTASWPAEECTEADIPRATIRNAALLHDCRRDPPGEADAAVLAALSTVVGQISIGDLRDATGYGGEAFRAMLAESYRYLVESIRKFPTRGAFAGMIERAGFRHVTDRALTGGIVAIHSGWKV